MPSLPIELLVIIIELLPLGPSSLRAVSLASRSLRQYALPRMFHGLSIYHCTSDEDYDINAAVFKDDDSTANFNFANISRDRFMQLADDTTCIHLLDHIRELRLVAGPDADTNDMTWNTACSKLRPVVWCQISALHLDLGGTIPLQGILVAVLQLGAQLEYLRISHFTRSAQLFDTIARHTTLRRLSLGPSHDGPVFDLRLWEPVAPRFAEPLQLMVSMRVLGTIVRWFSAVGFMAAIRGISLTELENESDSDSDDEDAITAFHGADPDSWSLLNGVHFVLSSSPGELIRTKSIPAPK
jgi:hypothetical protein